MEDPQFAGTNCPFLFRAKENRFACRWTRHQTCSPRTNPPTRTKNFKLPKITIDSNSSNRATQGTDERRTLAFDSSAESQGEESVPRRRSNSKNCREDAKASSTRHPPKSSRSSTSQTKDKTDAKASPTRHSPRSSTRPSHQKRGSSSSRSGERSTSRSASRSRFTRETRIYVSNSEVTSLTYSSSSDGEETLSKLKHLLKPPKFDGQTSFETFWAQFTNCAEHNMWSKPQKSVYLKSSLDNDVANILWDYDKDEISSLSGLTRILKNRYGGKSFTEKHRIELRNRRRRPDESISNLHVDIRRLAALAFPNVKRKARESIACDHFLDALDNPDLALKIRERQPSSLDSALRIALQLEVWTTDTNRLKDATKSDRSEPRRIREISNPAEPVEPSNETFQKEMERRFAELESRITQSHSYGNRPRGGYGPYRNGNSNPNSNPNFGRDQNSNYYPNTNSNSNPNSNANSNQYQCQSSTSNSNQYPCQSSGANSNRTCFRCGAATHWSRECPLAGTDLRAPSDDSRRPPPLQPQRNVRPMKYGSNGPNKACIWIKYKQYHLSALLDTGSDVTIAGEDVAEKMGWRIVEHRIKQVRVANNEPMCISGAVYADLTVGSRTVKSEILITPNRKGLILGIDWLRQQGYFQWDFDKGQIRLGEEDWMELCQEKRSICRIRPILSDLNEESDSTLESNFQSFRETAQEIPFNVSTIVRGSNYLPVSNENEFLPPVLKKFEKLPLPVQRKLDKDCACSA